jgi:hypothetical protein
MNLTLLVPSNGILVIKEFTLSVIRTLILVFARGFARFSQIIAENIIQPEPILEIPIYGEISNWDVFKFVLIYFVIRGRSLMDMLVMSICYYLFL